MLTFSRLSTFKPSSASVERAAQAQWLEYPCTDGWPQPRWQHEPRLEAVASTMKKALKLSKLEKVTASPISSGTTNKTYLIQFSTRPQEYVLRILLGTCPQHRTKSEAATMRYLATQTSIPVPRIVAMDSSPHNDIGFEWILMTRANGTTLAECWDDLTCTQKEKLCETLAGYYAQLMHYKFAQIGSISRTVEGPFSLDRFANMAFSRLSRSGTPTFKGPFTLEKTWLKAELTHIINDTELMLRRQRKKATLNRDLIDNLEIMIQNQRRLVALISRHPRIQAPVSARVNTILMHPDLHDSNILVDGEGNITSIIDWENSAVLPFWLACEPPAFLTWNTTDAPPQVEDYIPDSPLISARDREALSRAYNEAYRRWDQTQYLSCFVKNMRQLCPEWDEAYETQDVPNGGPEMRRIYNVIQFCDNMFDLRAIERWLDYWAGGVRTKTLQDARMEVLGEQRVKKKLWFD